MTRLWPLALLALAHCAPPEDNAVLLLRIKLPYAEGERPLADIQVNRDDPRFGFEDEVWITPKPHVADLRESREVELAVTTESPEAEGVAHLRVRIALCEEDGPCQGDANTPELQFLLEHPFYPGELTEWRAGPLDDDDAYHMPDSVVPGRQADIPRHQAFPVLIDRCSIAGCIELADTSGASFRPDPDTGFCRADGVHFCDEGD